MSKVLLLGCGSTRDRRVKVQGREDWSGQTLVTLDIEPRHKPDILWDLNLTPWGNFNDYSEDHSGTYWPDCDIIPAGEFDEVHAYELLEHLGRQGDLSSFFSTFYEAWRILKPDGRLAATVPRHDSMWAWGDPGHTRVINLGSLTFLDQQQYKDQVGRTAMADYRSYWRGDFELTWHARSEHNLLFILRAVKPPRLS